MGIALYLLGFSVLVSGLAWIATLIGIAQPVIAGAVLVMLTIAIVFAFFNARTRTQETA